MDCPASPVTAIGAVCLRCGADDAAEVVARRAVIQILDENSIMINDLSNRTERKKGGYGAGDE